MADITVTATAVIGAGKTREGTAGATIAAGEWVYDDTATGTLKLADNDSATAAVRVPVGIALNGGAAGQPIEYLYDGLLTMNAALTAGVPAFLSSTPGKMCPFADLGSGDYPTLLGYGITATTFNVNIVRSSVPLA